MVNNILAKPLVGSGGSGAASVWGGYGSGGNSTSGGDIGHLKITYLRQPKIRGLK